MLIQKKFSYSLRRAGYRLGFTLVEMMVATALFTMVIVMASASLVQISLVNRHVSADRILVDNLGFILEDMTRHIRFGGDEMYGARLQCGLAIIDPDNLAQDCAGGSGYLAMTPIGADPNITVQRVAYHRQLRPDGTGEVRKTTDSGANFLSLTHPRVDITRLRFYVDGSGLFDDRRARVLIFLSGKVTLPDGTERELHLQTTVEQRTADA